MADITLQVSASTDDARNVGGNGVFTAIATTQHIGKFDTTNKYWSGWRWQSVAIPKNATIVSATLDIYSAGVAAGTTAKAIFYGNLVGSATTFSNTTANKPEGKTRTSASVTKDFTVSSWSATGFGIETVDVKTIVQEIVNQATWGTGNDMAIVVGDNGSSNTNYIGFSTYDRDIARGAKLTISYTSGSEPSAPTDVTATQDGTVINVTWTDNSSNEDGFTISRSRGSSTNFYNLSSMAANVTTYTDSDVNPGYTYTYKVVATSSAQGNSLAAASSALAMSGTKTWTAKNQAWIYPGSPAQNASAEFTDGRTMFMLKPEYYATNTTGFITQKTVAVDGVNGFSTANRDQILANSTKQFVTVASNRPNMAALFANAANTNSAITTLTNFVVNNSFTGIELDWEGYGSWTVSDYANYKTFVTNLGSALHAQSKQLMIDGPPITNSTEQGFYQWKYEDFNNSAYIDYVVSLLYDYQYDYGAGESIQPNTWMRNGINWVRNKFTDVTKLVIGIPSYGYHGITGGYNITIDTQAQTSAQGNYSSATRNTDSEMVFTTNNTSFIYQDTTGLNQKRERIEDEGVKNVSVWHLGGNSWFNAYSENTTISSSGTVGPTGNPVNNPYPIADIYNSGWVAVSGAALWSMMGSADGDTSYVSVTNTGLPFKVLMGNPSQYLSDVMLTGVTINARTTSGSAYINGSAFDGDGVYLGNITKDIPSTSYSSYVVQFSGQTGRNLDGVTVEIQHSGSSANSTIAPLRVSELKLSFTGADIPAIPNPTLQESINRIYGYGLHDYSARDAIAKYLGLDDYYKGQYTFEQIYNVLHFNDIKKDARAWDPVAYNANVRGAVDLGTFGPLDGKRYTRAQVAAKQFEYNAAGPVGGILWNSFPTVERYSFNRVGNGLVSSQNNTLYTNANAASAYQDNGKSLFVGYSAGVFATGATPGFLPTAVGSVGVQFDLKPFIHSSGYTGGTTIFELPNYMRVDFSGSGFNQFVVNLHDGSSYVSALQSNGVTFGAGQPVKFEIFCLLPELTIIYMVNGTANAFYSDSAFNGGTYPGAFYLGTNASKTNPWSGAINELRFTTDIKLLD